MQARSGRLHAAGDLDARCHDLLQMVGLDAKATRYPRDLTQVEMRKLELARAMAAEPKLLIADESMAGLSHSEIDDILALLVRLNEQGITVILIEHIMRAVMSFSQRIVVLVSGRRSPTASPTTWSTIPKWWEPILASSGTRATRAASASRACTPPMARCG